jgi:hypothetical protein
MKIMYNNNHHNHSLRLQIGSLIRRFMSSILLLIHSYATHRHALKIMWESRAYKLFARMEKTKALILTGYFLQELQKVHLTGDPMTNNVRTINAHLSSPRQEWCPLLHFCSEPLRWHTPHCNLIRTKAEKTRIKWNVTRKEKENREVKLISFPFTPQYRRWVEYPGQKSARHSSCHTSLLWDCHNFKETRSCPPISSPSPAAAYRQLSWANSEWRHRSEAIWCDIVDTRFGSYKIPNERKRYWTYLPLGRNSEDTSCSFLNKTKEALFRI